MLPRSIAPAVVRTLRDTPVVLLNGPRQSGKSTLVQALAQTEWPARYLTLDDAVTLAAAHHDPVAFIDGLQGASVIDEVQQVPELFRAIKRAVDGDRRPGRFLLTGSANVLLLPKLSESLAGRMEILTLHPFSAGEIDGTAEAFIDAVFGESFEPGAHAAIDRETLFGRMLVGGYPEVIQRSEPERRRAWFGAYVTTVLQKDVRDMAAIEGFTQMPRLLALLAAQSGGLLNIASLSRDTGLSQPTLKRYLTLLEATFLFQPLLPWSANLGKRLTKTPKAFLNDAGLLGYLLGLETEDLAGGVAASVGPLAETFVLQEVRKQASWSQTRPAVFFYRTAAGREVDIVLEDRRHRIVGIEIKAAATVTRSDFKGLEDLADAVGKRFRRGVVLHAGNEAVQAGPALHAVPIGALWRSGLSAQPRPRRHS
jgi:predicted AAA+ superfamily ATPase